LNTSCLSAPHDFGLRRSAEKPLTRLPDANATESNPPAASHDDPADPETQPEMHLRRANLCRQPLVPPATEQDHAT